MVIFIITFDFLGNQCSESMQSSICGKAKKEIVSFLFFDLKNSINMYSWKV